MKYSNYLEFKQYIWNEYVPFAEEITSPEQGYPAGTSWAKRQSPRFFRALQTIDSLIGQDRFVLVDVGAYPGSFCKLAKESFGESISDIYACGLAPDEEFEKNLGTSGISFFICNLDPDIVSPFDAPVGIPLPDNSVDCITLMEVVEHLYSVKTIMLECHRVLKPGGIVYVTTNNISDRVGLLRVFEKNSTNLDEDLEQTSIWSDHQNTWRGHVRFFSLNQLCEVGKRAGLKIEKIAYFDKYHDPDVFPKPQSDWLPNVFRKRLLGDGSRPPIYLKTMIKSLMKLGIRSLSDSYKSHIEILYRKPY